MATKLNLQADFAPVSKQAWKDKIIADLKGADFDKKLVWRTPEGFSVQPFYRREDLKGLKTTVSLKNKNERMKSVQFLPIFHSFFYFDIKGL